MAEIPGLRRLRARLLAMTLREQAIFLDAVLRLVNTPYPRQQFMRWMRDEADPRVAASLARWPCYDVEAVEWCDA